MPEQIIFHCEIEDVTGSVLWVMHHEPHWDE